MVTAEHFIAHMRTMVELIEDAPTPAQWASVRRQLALVEQGRAPDWYEPPFAAPRVILDDLPVLLPPGTVTC